MRVLTRFRYAPLIVYWAILLTATHLPPRHMPHVEVNDKFEHLTAYTILATLVGLSFARTKSIRNVILLTMVIVMIGGALDEWTQPWFGRDCELNDWFADTCGAVIGSLIAIGIRSMTGAFNS